MAKRTKKYTAALEAARAINIDGYATWGGDYLYKALAKMGWFWNSDKEIWEHLSQPADPPTDLVRIRVWAAADLVEEVAGQIVQNNADWLALVEQSEAYPCRPPKQLESRVYLTFKRKE